jgi:hypothetical protein
VPEDGGLTVEAQPVLYWYLSGETKGRIDVTIVDEASVTPLLETTIAGPLAPGVHPIRLADHQISLQPGVNYQWFVALVPDAERRSNDVIAGGGIERVVPSDPLREKLAAAQAPSRSFVSPRRASGMTPRLQSRELSRRRRATSKRAARRAARSAGLRRSPGWNEGWPAGD